MRRNQMLESKIAEARQIISAALPPEVQIGACLYHAVAMSRVLPGCQIIAGSYSWKFTHKDDGQNATHFSCIFDNRAQQQAARILTTPDLIKDLPHFPEMHVFNYYQGKVLDISTRWIPQFAQKIGDFFFDDVLRPPPYLWDVPVHKAKRWLYVPHPIATQLARAAAINVLK